MRWDPFRDLMGIHGELNRLFGRDFGEDDMRGTWAPTMDVYEDKERFVITLELPGIDPADVDISVEDSALRITGQRKFYRELSEDNFHRVERRYGQFSRTLTLPQTANVDAVNASFEDGLLTLDIPKKEEAKPRRIEIQAKA
ncbi:MAG TPA: Hsp20/alpha crystallin family protein [Actinomycetota bacterium]|nr:Hsp20/alpha crystallin family protein [Actinomycetota bacterium]